MRVLKINLKGRGREEMSKATSPDELIRMYDGKDNPIGKAYTKEELKKMFSKFSKLQFKIFYVPLRAFRLRLPVGIHRWLSSLFGLMLLARVEK